MDKAVEFLSPMKRTLERNLLKYSAGTAILCPHCQAVADARRWVVVTQGERTAGLWAPAGTRPHLNPTAC